MSRNQDLYDAICRGDKNIVEQIAKKAALQGADVICLLTESMIPAMKEIGERFSRNEVYVPEMLIAARAMQSGLDIIEPLLTKTGYEAPAKVCIGTVKGDLHDIGKNLVAMMLKGSGFEVDDLGTDCSVDKFISAIKNGSTVVCLSALLTTTMTYMKTVVQELKDYKDVKIVIGGAPVTQEYADEISAHGYAANANAAVKLILALI